MRVFIDLDTNILYCCKKDKVYYKNRLCREWEVINHLPGKELTEIEQRTYPVLFDTFTYHINQMEG